MSEKWRNRREWITCIGTVLTLLIVPACLGVAKLWIENHDLKFEKVIAASYVTNAEFLQHKKDQKAEMAGMNRKIDTLVGGQGSLDRGLQDITRQLSAFLNSRSINTNRF